MSHERSGRRELRICQRQPSIALAQLPRCPRDMLDANADTVAVRVMPGPVSQRYELHDLAVAPHDEVRRRLRLGLLETLDAPIGALLTVGDVNHDQRYRFASTATVVGRRRPGRCGIFSGHRCLVRCDDDGATVRTRAAIAAVGPVDAATPATPAAAV